MDTPFRSIHQSLLVALCFLTAISLAAGLSGCATEGQSTAWSREARETRTVEIAADYAQDHNLARAQARLDELHIASAAQWVAMLAERHIAEGHDEDVTRQLAGLAQALGCSSEKIARYLAPPTPTPTAMPTAEPTPTASPTATPIPPTPTPEVPTPTPVPPTPTPEPLTPTLVPKPHVVVKAGGVNVRSGPGTTYPRLATVEEGQQFDIVARNQTGDWWQICCLAGKKGWVYAPLVNTDGPTDAVAVASHIPTPPPTPTPAPPTATPTPTKPAVDYIVKSVRLRPVGQGAQRCNAGENSIWVYVIDPAGNPLDGVRVREIFTNHILVTGAQGKGPGRVQYDIYRGGGGQVEIVDEAGNRISEVSRGMSADWPDFDLLKEAGYCNCKPHPDDASCQADLVNKTYFFAVGHYCYEVVFQRTW